MSESLSVILKSKGRKISEKFFVGETFWVLLFQFVDVLLKCIWTRVRLPPAPQRV